MKLLIIEDDRGSQEILKENLETRGFECCITEVPDEAFKELSTGGYEAVLCDIRLPNVSGMDHIEKLCRDYPELVTVVMTGYPSLETCLDAMQLGAYGYLVKPFKVDAVQEMLERGHRERCLRAEVDSLRLRVQQLEQELGQQGSAGGTSA